MKGGGAQVQTVSIIDTISELASNQGDRERITQVRATRTSAPGTSMSAPAPIKYPLLGSEQTSKYPPPPPRHPMMSLPASNFLATNINISQMSLPPHNSMSGASSVLHSMSGTASIPHSSMSSSSGPRQFSVSSKAASAATGRAFDEFSSGLDRSGFLNSTMKSLETDLGERRRRRKKIRSVKNGARGLGETPDWIKELFNFAKKGDLEQLKEALADMERTLIRNLSDHLGNNLLHVVCRHGHVSLLPWLASRLGPELDNALGDENKRGLIPVTLAIKHGQRALVSWLVEHTRDRERLGASNGERCLLHCSAQHGQDGISGWLCEEMTRDGLDIDQMDLGGNTPLHLAARQGNTTTASTLLNLGASVNMKNDMGLKPSDCASVQGRADTAEFLVMFETALGVTRELLARERSEESAASEASDIKTNFKDVLSVSKKLAKEREEMCKDLSRLHESMIELHDKMIMEMQILAKENSSLKKTNGVHKEENSLTLAATIERCDSLHERWQHHQQTYFSAPLADMEHRIILAEDRLKKHKTQQPHLAEIEQSYAHRNLRDRLEEARASVSSLAGARQLSPSCSSESESSADEADQSEASIRALDQSEARETDTSELGSPESNFYEKMRSPNRSKQNIAQRKKLATPSPIKTRNSSDPNMNESLYSSVSSPIYSAISSPSDRKLSVTSLAEFSGACALEFSELQARGMDYNSAKVAASELARSGGAEASPGRKEDRRRSRTDLKKRLQQLALTSETGSASVIEVIEPNSSEEEEFKKSMQEMNISWVLSQSEARVRGLDQSEPMTPLSRSRRLVAEPQQPSPAPSSRTSKTSESSGAASGRGSRLAQQRPRSEAAMTNHRAGAESVLTNQSQGMSKNLLRSEPDLLSGVRRLGEDKTMDSIDIDKLEGEDNTDLLNDTDFGEEFYSEDLQMLPYDLESERGDSSMQMKKKGFLQKLSISKWAGKKKFSKSSGTKVKEIAPEYFRETYGLQRDTESLLVSSSRERLIEAVSPGVEAIVRTDQSEARTRPMDQSENVRASVRNQFQPGQGSEIRAGVTTITVGQDHLEHRDRSGEPMSDGSRMTKSLSPSSRKSGAARVVPDQQGMMVANSDDSGIIARPMSSASKSETTSLSRPDSSSSSSDQPIRTGYLERVSPIGSEQPRAESGSSGDFSNSSGKLGKIEENPSSSASSPMTTIITLKSSSVNNNNSSNSKAVRKSSTVKRRTGGREAERAWYDLSDEDIEIPSPDHITSIISVRGSSDEDTF